MAASETAPPWVPLPAPKRSVRPVPLPPPRRAPETVRPRFYCRWQPGCAKGCDRVIYHHVDCKHNRPDVSRPVTVAQYQAILALLPRDRYAPLKGRRVELVICKQCKRLGRAEQ